MDVLISEIHRTPVALTGLVLSTDRLSEGSQEMIFMIGTEMLRSVTASQHYEHMQAQWKTRGRHDRAVKPTGGKDRLTQSSSLVHCLIKYFQQTAPWCSSEGLISYNWIVLLPLSCAPLLFG